MKPQDGEIYAVDLAIAVCIAVGVRRPRAEAALPGEKVGAIDVAVFVEVGACDLDYRIGQALMVVSVIDAADFRHGPLVDDVVRQTEYGAGVPRRIRLCGSGWRLPDSLFADLEI